MPAISFESYDRIISLITRGRAINADLDDLLIDLCAANRGCETTVTSQKRITATGWFERP